jgi:hypothetical protein
MQSVDLALYADSLAAEAAAASARLERARGRLRRVAIEHAARRELPVETVVLLERRGLLQPVVAGSRPADTSELVELIAELAALQRAQAWVEARLHEAQATGPRVDRTREGEHRVTAD